MKAIIKTCPRKKQYLEELIGNEYRGWEGKKVIITAPTGIGKTTFIISVLIPHLSGMHRKLLILCNRKLLRKQYWIDLIKRYDNYAELMEDVELMTYQELAAKIKSGTPAESLLSKYSVIVCDEAHYFYEDSDFNGFGTYVLLQEIVKAAIMQEIIFMSATTEHIKPIIKQTIRNYIQHQSISTDKYLKPECGEIIEKDYAYLEDYSRFTCFSLPDDESLYDLLANSSGKSVVFMDDTGKAKQMRERLITEKSVEDKQIVILNAENIDADKNEKFIQKLTIGHKVECKILITTSVLDNGVSIHDPDVENLIIITESKTKFLQMIGRVRAESVENCKLYFLVREDSEFKKRENNYEWEKNRFEELKKEDISKRSRHYFYTVWDMDNEEMARFYRKALVLSKHESQYYVLPEEKVWVRHGHDGFYINEFAKQKTENMYLTECRFFSLAISDPLEVIYEQMRWIGKAPDELQIQESTYREEKLKEMQEELLSVQDYTKEQLQDFKKEFVRKYRADFFPDILAKNGTVSLEKLKEICQRYGFELIQEKDEDRRERYTINKINE